MIYDPPILGSSVGRIFISAGEARGKTDFPHNYDTDLNVIFFI